ncbi:hypothetical protein [Pantoea sp. KPR_PJ]|uniref:hypothetical protein n=1 Tax=Pantoea sp. KPR_PJ TaxID=2738375 RepID=UPI0035272741
MAKSSFDALMVTLPDALSFVFHSQDSVIQTAAINAESQAEYPMMAPFSSLNPLPALRFV